MKRIFTKSPQTLFAPRKTEPHLTFFRRLLLLLLLAGAALSRPLTSPDSAFVTDGVDGGGNGGLLCLSRREQTYGFLPWTESAVGNLFLAVVYGYLMFNATTYLSSGSELLLEVPGPGIIGCLFSPLLGALPDALLILGLLPFFLSALVLDLILDGGCLIQFFKKMIKIMIIFLCGRLKI